MTQPPPLQFRGRHRLIVERAPEPQEILWENLEVSGWSHALRSIAVFFGLLWLMAVSFAITYATMRIHGVRILVVCGVRACVCLLCWRCPF